MRREIARWSRRKIYLFAMIIVPVGMALFLLSLLYNGLPLKVPVAVVDMDHSSMSRSVTRALGATELLDIQYQYTGYAEAMASVREGTTFGFFMIPENFQRDALAGRTPTLEYYSDMTYFVPGTLTFKGFKTIAVSTAGAVVKTTLVSVGIDDNSAGAMLQPMVIQDHPIGNPWMSYAIYLCPSFIFATFALMLMLTTVYSITSEIKTGSSVEWLATARGRISVAIAGKLLPQTAVACVVAALIASLMFGYNHFPVNGSLPWLMVGIVLFIVATQAFALFITCVVPNPRLAMSVVSLFGILTFSFDGFSFPVQSMYGAIAIFSYLSPMRYMFLIYINEALNGFDLYYSRMSYVALMLFPIAACSLLWRLKRAALNPVYVP